MQLNEEQLLAVEHPLNEPACLIAGAGSGKTATMTARVKWLIDRGVKPRRIAVITFTNRAAAELVSRIGVTDPHSLDSPRVSTIHSLALSAIRKNPQGFGLPAKVSPLDDYDQTAMMKKIIERGKIADTNPYAVLEKIKFHRARGVGFRVDYTDDIAEATELIHAGYHVLGDVELKLWSLYEIEKTRTGSIDFDDMILLCNRRFAEDAEWKRRIQAMWDHVLVDEVQDISKIQWQFIEGLLAPNNFNLFAVGDLNQSIYSFTGAAPYLLKQYSEGWRGVVPRMYKIQRNHRSVPEIVELANAIQAKMTNCHPPGTVITTIVKGRRSLGRNHEGENIGTAPAEFSSANIEALMGGEKIQPWNRHTLQTTSTGRGFTAASQFYSGPMLRIVAENGASTRVTPEHWLWIRFNRRAIYGEYVVYLMYKEGVGFRVGKTRFRSNQNGFGLTGRLTNEGGDRAWVLRVLPTNQEAQIWEEIYSVKYGVPESVFKPTKGPKSSRSQADIDLIFSTVPQDGGFRCLKSEGLLFEHPLVMAGKRPWGGYFKTIAANVVPLARYVDIPTRGVCQSTLISNVYSEFYEGLVYSLDVDKHHTYVADGLVVGNSIPLKMESWRGMNGEHGTRELLEGIMAPDVAASIAAEIYRDNEKFMRDAATVAQGGKPRISSAQPIPYRDNCILIRAAIQLRDLEAELVKRRIPYVVRGGRGLLQTEEVRDVLAYMRLATNHKDFMAFVRAAQVPRRGCGEVALEKIRAYANEKFDGDLIEAAMVDRNAKVAGFGGIVKIVSQFSDAPRKMLQQVFDLTKYADYIKEKYKKDSNKVKDKLENLDRFASLIEGLVEEGSMTAEDMIFQLTLDRPKDDDEQGAVTISTIHSAKGLEWKRCYVANVVEGSLPHWRCNGEDEWEEERRLFYVACTRARDSLVICVPEMEQHSPNTRILRPSRFLEEIGVV